MKALKFAKNGERSASSTSGKNHAYMQALASSAQLICEFRQKTNGEKSLHKDLHSWGYIDQISRQGPNVVSQVEVLPGHQMSFDRHDDQGHFISIVAGRARALINDELTLVGEGECLFIPQGAKHVINNPDNRSLVFIQVNVRHNWRH